MKLLVINNLASGYGEGAIYDFMRSFAADGDDICLDRVFVTHTCPDEALVQEIVEQVKATLPFKEVLETRAGCTISAHCGPGTLGVLFIRKTPKQKA